MATNAVTLAALIRTKLLADPATQAVDNPALTAFCAAIASAVLEHLTAAAEVVPMVAPDPFPMFAGVNPVTGKAKIT